MGQGLASQVNGIRTRTLGIWVRGERRDRNLVLTVLLFLNYENHSHIKILASVFFPVKVYEIMLLLAGWSSSERKISFISWYNVHNTIWQWLYGPPHGDRPQSQSPDEWMEPHYKVLQRAGQQEPIVFLKYTSKNAGLINEAQGWFFLLPFSLRDKNNKKWVRLKANENHIGKAKHSQTYGGAGCRELKFFNHLAGDVAKNAIWNTHTHTHTHFHTIPPPFSLQMNQDGGDRIWWEPSLLSTYFIKGFGSR